MLYRSINKRRHPGRDHTTRLTALEDSLGAASAPTETSVEHIFGLFAWATKAGDYTRDLARRYWALQDEWFASFIEADQAGDIVPGERFPRLFTGHWNISPERQARWDAIDQEQKSIHAELESLRSAAQQGGWP